VKLPSDPTERELLVKLYGFAIDEYRFAVRINSDRTRDYLVINLGLITITTGLFRLDNGRAVTLLVILMFAVGVTISWSAARAAAKGHAYYRRAAFKKTLIEEQLGLFSRLDVSDHPDANLAIGTTFGMANVERMLRDPDSWLKARLSPGSIMLFLVRLLKLLAFVNACGLVLGLIRLLRATPAVSNRFPHLFG